MSRRSHNRVTVEGQQLGKQLVRLSEPTLKLAIDRGVADGRCDSCAFREGTVPNGCIQTQMDALKAVMEGVPFMCHQTPDNSEYCFGWLIARAALAKSDAPMVTEMPWDFSPADPK